MAKYIIDIPDEEETMWEGFNGDLFIPITMNKGTRTWVNTDLKMIPYTEPDRKAIENEVWEFAKKIASFNGLAKQELEKCFGHTTIQGVMTTYDTYQEAKEKYEAWRKQKDNVVEQKVVDLAEEIGIHRLYAIVREIRGE